MDQLNTKAIWGLISIAILGGIGLAAKEAISNFWAGISFMLNPNIHRGMTLEAKVQGELLKGALKKFGLSRIVIEDQNRNTHLILISDLKKTTIKLLGEKSKQN